MYIVGIPSFICTSTQYIKRYCLPFMEYQTFKSTKNRQPIGYSWLYKPTLSIFYSREKHASPQGLEPGSKNLLTRKVFKKDDDTLHGFSKKI